MEVVGALASSLQIVSQCSQITITIIKWVESVKTVDARIDSFVHEVNTLKMTYEALSRSLKEPSMLEAARITNRDVGGHLWTQMSRTLQDCERTMIFITNVLRRIQSSSNLLRPVIKQLRENLNSGELSRLREQVVMFNSSLQLPMQMITLTLQLRQQEMTTAAQLQLNDQLTSLRRGIERVERISRGIQAPAPPRQSSIGGSTLVGDSAGDKAWLDNIESYVGTAKKFLDSASVAATTLSAPSLQLHEDDSPVYDGARRGSSFVPLTLTKLRSINVYVDDLPIEGGVVTPLASDGQSMTEPPPDTADDSEEDDVDLQLLQVLLQNGQTEADKGRYAEAEDNYREALSLSQNNQFGSQIACSTADIALMLGECLARQETEEKYDEAIELLQPLTEQLSSRTEKLSPSSASVLSHGQRSAEKGQALSASHLLGKVYLKKPDLVNAETHAVAAFKGRKKLLGESHPKTIESVLLVIEMYKAKGQNARAEAHKIFLKPVQSVQDPRPLTLSPSLSNTSSPPAQAESIPIPIDSPSNRSRRPTFNFSSPFKRSDRNDAPPTSAPMNRTKNPSGSSPYLVADDFAQLSTSPHDTSSLHIGSDIRPVERQIRKESSNSNEYGSTVQPWATTTDSMDQYSNGHQRTRSSLSRAPTLYAGLSRSDMEEKYLEIARLCRDGKGSKAVDLGMPYLQKYDPDSALLVHRAAELKKNIKESKNKGLAGTGYGFAPIHFFCSMKYEPLIEVDILLEQEVNVNAVAYKAGYGKVNPFTPLTLAVERGNHNIARMLLDRGATWNADLMKVGHRFNPDRDAIHPLLQACSRGHTTIVELLLEHNLGLEEEHFPRMSWHGNSLFHEACFRCDTQMIEFLMSYARRKNILTSTEYSFIGRPGQQDVFGMTPLMYAVDMRDSTDQRLKAHKLSRRVKCLRLLLEQETEIRVEDAETEEVVVEHPREQASRLATDLHIEDKKGNTVYWYADEARGGDTELRTFLDEQSGRSQLIDF